MKRVLICGALVGSLAMLALTGVASAKPGDRSLEVTYPIASKLCARATGNVLPKSLAGDESQLTGYCTALQSSYDAAVSTAQTAEQTYSSGVQSARVTELQACEPVPTTAAGHQACRQARRQRLATVTSLRRTWRLAVDQYHVSIEQARVTFWTSVHALRGGASITPDQPQPNAPVPSA
jgi:hypothetical protein